MDSSTAPSFAWSESPARATAAPFPAGSALARFAAASICSLTSRICCTASSAALTRARIRTSRSNCFCRSSCVALTRGSIVTLKPRVSDQPDGDPDLVARWHRERTPRVPRPEHETLEPVCVRVAQIPNESVQARVKLEGVPRLLWATREPSDYRIARVEDVECRFLFGLLLQVAVHDRAVRWVG